MEIKRSDGFSEKSLLGTPKVVRLLKVEGVNVVSTTDRPVYEQTPDDYSVNSILESNGDPKSGATFSSQPDLSETDAIMATVANTNFKLDNKKVENDEKKA